MKSKLWQILALIILAFVIRVLFVPQGAVSFHYDMARDAFIAEQIWKEHNLKIIGPPTSIPGLYHGVIYYYLLAIFYLIGQGNPITAAILMSLLSSLTIIPVYLLAEGLFKQKRWAFLAGLLFAISFEASQYGPWLSNPSPAILSMAWFFYGLWLWLQKSSKGLVIAAVSAALSMQFQFFLIYTFVVLGLFYLIFRTRLVMKELFITSLLVLMILASYLLAIIKFQSFNQVSQSLLSISGSNPFTTTLNFSQLLINYLNRYTEIFINNFIPTNIFIGGLLGLLATGLSISNRFILFCLLSNILIYLFGGHSSAYANVGMVVPAIMAVILLLQKLGRLHRLVPALLLIIMLISNIQMIKTYNPQGQGLLVIPKDMMIQKQLNLIDKSYQLAEGQPFTINSLTVPLWTNTTWAYLYKYYGLPKYGYLPTFSGRDQIGQLGAEVIKSVPNPEKKHFLIIDPAEGIPATYYQSEVSVEDHKTKLIEEFRFGSLRLQYRQPLINDQKVTQP